MHDPFFKNKTVAVVGAGDPALEAALYVKELASKVYIIHRTDRPVRSEETIKLLQQQSDNNNKNVSFTPNSIAKTINGNSKVESLTVYNSKTKSNSELHVYGVFVEMGYIAKTDKGFSSIKC